jgi:H+/Cl- antiporter ClcA
MREEDHGIGEPGRGAPDVNAQAATAPPDPVAILRSRQYIALLVLAAILGVPISAAAYGFLALIHYLQRWIFDDLPGGLGFESAPWWWPVPVLAVAGVLVGLAIRYLPGRGGHSPAEGFKPGSPTPIELPGVVLAALVGLGLGVVLGPEAPLIALGGGLAIWAVRLVRRDLPARTVAVVAAAGAFAAISTLLGSPIVGAFLLMEVSAVAGPMLGVMLIPGLLAAGIGSLIFVGLGSWTGLGTLSLAVPDLPAARPPDAAQFGWAILIGLAAAVVGSGIRWLALLLQRQVERSVVVLTTVAGVVIAVLAVAYAEGSGRDSSEVLFSGQEAIGPLLTQSQGYSVGALLLLIACKGLGYSVALASFRGGPVFPAMFVGAAGGIALSHLPGLPPVAGAAMGIAAMCAVLLRFPLTSVLLASLFLGTDGLRVMPLVIVSVVVAYVASARMADVFARPDDDGQRAG